jgi:hypothetical protein
MFVHKINTSNHLQPLKVPKTKELGALGCLVGLSALTLLGGCTFAFCIGTLVLGQASHAQFPMGVCSLLHLLFLSFFFVFFFFGGTGD